jgi:hypothetical protein
MATAPGLNEPPVLPVKHFALNSTRARVVVRAVSSPSRATACAARPVLFSEMVVAAIGGRGVHARESRANPQCQVTSERSLFSRLNTPWRSALTSADFARAARPLTYSSWSVPRRSLRRASAAGPHPGTMQREFTDRPFTRPVTRKSGKPLQLQTNPIMFADWTHFPGDRSSTSRHPPNRPGTSGDRFVSSGPTPPVRHLVARGRSTTSVRAAPR